jgi:hypothetical protein
VQYEGNSYGYNKPGNLGLGINRVWWELSGNAIVGGTASGPAVPTTTELYSVEFFGTHFHGIVGEGNDGNPPNPSIDAHIPWQGQFGTNHQWIGGDGKDNGTWNAMNNNGVGGPQAPNSPAFNAPGTGTYMDFSFPIDRSWSALRLTQVTPLPVVPVEGDYNGNGVVDGADYVVWRDNLGRQEDNLTAAQGDGVDDDIIDELDYFIWRENFGDTSGSGTGSSTSSRSQVPEPGTLTFLALAAAVCLASPRKLKRLLRGRQVLD